MSDATSNPSSPGKRIPRPKDLKPVPLEELAWDDASCQGSLGGIYAHVTDDARAAIEWYMSHRKPKRRMALFARVSAILLVSLAGLLPLVSALIEASWERTIPPLFTSLAIGLGALLLALDRFGGNSTGWMRYIGTEQKLRTALEEFELEWQCRRAAWRGAAPTTEQVGLMLVLSKEFTARINGIVAEETNVWMQEFQASIKQVDDAVKAAEDQQQAREDARRRGALTVVLSNAAQVKGGWKLSVDGGPGRIYMGPSAGIVDLAPGPHLIRVEGKVEDGTERSSELSADVPPGATATAQITL